MLSYFKPQHQSHWVQTGDLLPCVFAAFFTGMLSDKSKSCFCSPPSCLWKRIGNIPNPEHTYTSELSKSFGIIFGYGRKTVEMALRVELKGKSDWSWCLAQCCCLAFTPQCCQRDRKRNIRLIGKLL